MTSKTTCFCFTSFLMLAMILAGCGDGDVSTEAIDQRIDERVDLLLGNLDESRKTLAELKSKIEYASAAELAQLVEQREQLRDSLPVLAGIELSGELAELDWLSAVRQAISVKPTPISLLDAETLLAEVPPSLKDFAPKLSSAHASQTIKLANQLAQSEFAEADDLEVVLNLLGRLQSYEGSPGEELTNLTQMLRAKLKSLTDQQLADDLKSEADSLQTQLDNITKIKDASLRRTALAALSQTVDAIRVRFAMENIAGPEAAFAELRSKIDEQLTESIQSLGREQEEILSKARMKYQAWALDQIQRMQAVLEGNSIDKELYFLRDNAADSKEPVKVELAQYGGVRQRLEQVLGELNEDLQLTADQQAKIRQVVKDNWHDLVYQAKHDAAVRYLLPVNQGLLEPPVAKFYNEAFETTWQKIEDGDGMQLSLARKTAEVPKRSLESFMESSK